MRFFFKLNQSDIEMFVESFFEPIKLRSHGLFFDGVLYECLRSDDDSIYGRFVRNFNKNLKNN